MCVGWPGVGWPGVGWPGVGRRTGTGAVPDCGAVESQGLPEARPGASAGVTIGSAGVAVLAGASASVNETAAGRGVGGGIRLDSNERTGPVAEGPVAEAGTDASAACFPASTVGPDKAGATDVAGACPAKLLPHAWQLVCPLKTSRAPQNWQVGFSAPDSNVTLNP